MKQGRKWLRWVMPLMAVTFLNFSQSSFAQDNNNDQYNDNSGNYDNSDDALIDPEQDVNYNTFHDELSPYGNWTTYPGYGNVWVCNVAGFRPYYSGGHWVYTRFGWTWVSDYNWGWAPFHYGRWGYDASYGYFWVPGYTWGPAWVSWRNGGDYYGWAPLSPGLSVGINVGVGIGAASWVFLPHRYMGYRNSYNYYAPRQNNVTIIKNTTIINNTNVYNNNRFVTGPDRRQVERYSGQRVQQENIYVTNNRNNNGKNTSGGIQMYHPNVNRNSVNNRNGVQQNGQLGNGAAQGNIRPQPAGGRPTQNGVQQQPNNNSVNGAQANSPTNRFQQRREDRMQRRENGDDNNKGAQNNVQGQQDMQNMRNQMQNQNNDQRRQQIEQMREQRQQNEQQQDAQQQAQQRQQQMNDNRQQMQQQMEQQRQQREAQQQQVQQQNRQEQMQQQREQMQQQRQQQFQQRNMNNNRPAMQQGGGGGGRKGRNF